VTIKSDDKICTAKRKSEREIEKIAKTVYSAIEQTVLLI